MSDTPVVSDVGASRPDVSVADEVFEFVSVEALSVVSPGDNDGWAHLVMRSLGFQDGRYDDLAAQAVEEIQENAGLEPDGVIAGSTWAYVLPELSPGAVAGFEVGLLRKLLGCAPGDAWDGAVNEALALLDSYQGAVTAAVWLDLITNGPVI